ncbi:MAG: photosynthetic complex assembly protein PuhC [Pseudomonadota bacterium]
MSVAEPHHHHDEIKVPKPLLIAVGCVLALSVAIAALASSTGAGVLKPRVEDVAASASLVFVDEPDGAVSVHAADTGETVHVFSADSGGFVRTAMRAIAFERRRRGIGSAPPVTLARTTDGRLILSDPSTSKSVALNAFSDASAASFAVLLQPEGRGDDHDRP